MGPAEAAADVALLLARAQSGDAQAFSAIVGLYEEKAIHTAYAFLGNMEDARDAAQESFVKAYQSLRSFQKNSKFSTWLVRIVINQCKDMLRKRKSRGFFQMFRPSGDREEKDPVEQAVSPAPDSRRMMMNAEIEDSVRQAMEKLPFQQKSVFALRYLEGMSLEEIAESMGLSQGAVKAHLWQAGQKMKKNLAHLVSRDGGGS